MGESKPLVSIIIPTYNRAAHLQTAVDSCLAQQYDNLEIVIIDDGSTDDTPRYLESLVNEHGKDRIRAVRQENQGANTARNHGLDVMQGDYVQFLDSDDQLRPEKISVQVQALEQSGNDLAICDYRNISPDGQEEKSEIVLNDVDLFTHLARLYPLTISTPLYRASLIDENMRFNPYLKWKDEMDFIFKFGLLIADWDYTPGPYFEYCHHADHRITSGDIDHNWYWQMFLGQQEFWREKRSQISRSNFWMLRTCWLRLARLAKAAGQGEHTRVICRQIAMIPGVTADMPDLARVYLGSWYGNRRQPQSV